jgi:hypothetical protein
MRRCKWLRRSSINYEISDLSNNTDSLTPLVEAGLLQDSKKIFFDFQIKYSLFCSFIIG